MRNKEIEKIIAQGLTCADMHIHSSYSSDSSASVNAILEKAEKMKIGIAITDHHIIEGSLKAFDNDKGILVIPGIEVACKEGPHILVYFNNSKDLFNFYNKNLIQHINKPVCTRSNIEINDLLNCCKKYKCYATAAHPFGMSKRISAGMGIMKYVNQTGDFSIFERIDFIEGANSSLRNKTNMKSIRLSKSLKKPITGGSDSHSIAYVGSMLTASTSLNKPDAKEFLQDISQGKSIIIGKEIMFLRNMMHLSGIVRRHLKNKDYWKNQYNNHIRTRIAKIKPRIIATIRRQQD